VGARIENDKKAIGEGNNPVIFSPMLFTPEEAAEQLSVGRTTVYGLIGCGRLRSVRIGGSRRIRHQDLVTFVEELGSEIASQDD
jgi:excisionase family DNA binding protein